MASGGGLSICLVAHPAFGALSGRSGHIGGVATQTSMLARWLASRGHRVGLVTWDEGQADGSRIDGVTVFKTCRADQGWPGLRFVYPRWWSLNAALRRADASVYYHNCAEYETGQVAIWCRAHGRKFVYSAASNADCDAKLPLLDTARDRVLFRYGLRRADRIVVQTETQRVLLRSGFGLDSVVIPIPCSDSGFGDAREPRGRDGRDRVLWVGRLSHEKRPDRLLDVAVACPQIGFDLVGPTDGSPYAKGVVERARTAANVTVHGGVSRQRIDELLDRAVCLCGTSDIEGFPNTFIESCSRGVPVVSTFDPDGIIARHGLGRAAADVGSLVPALRAVVADRALWTSASTRARRYYLDTHRPESVMPRFERLFADVSKAPGSSSS